jgi:hypothetical protein
MYTPSQELLVPLSRLAAADENRHPDGQLLLLGPCHAVIAALPVTVVVNLSEAHLCRRAVVAPADR